MGRGTALSTLRAMFKAQCGYSLTTGVNTVQDAEINSALSQMQQWLWTEYQWPFLYTHEDVAMVAGTRYYNYPSVVSLDYVTKVETGFTNRWYDVDFGISGEEYEAINPDLAMRSDPVRRWQTYSATQFEVWPNPSTAQTLRFWGTKSVTPLVADGDLALLDDLLIVLFTAAEKQLRSKQPDAQAKLERAKALFARLKGASKPRMVFVMNGAGYEEYRRRERVVTIASNH